MMDYFDIFNSMASTNMTGKIFSEETDTPQVDEEVIESWKEYEDALAKRPSRGSYFLKTLFLILLKNGGIRSI